MHNVKPRTDHTKSSSLLLNFRLESAMTLILDRGFLNLSFMTPSPPQSLLSVHGKYIPMLTTLVIGKVLLVFV